MNHWSILPLRYRRTVSRTSEGSSGFERLGVALAVKLPIARSLVVGTTRAGSRGRVVCASEAVGLIATRLAAKTPNPASLIQRVTWTAILFAVLRVMTASP